MSFQDTRSEVDKVLGLFDIAGTVRDGLASSGVQSGEDMAQARRPKSTDNLLGLDLSGMPQSPMAAAREKYGKGELFFRNLLSRGGEGIWASALLPDVYGEGAQDKYKTEMEVYKLGLADQIKRHQMSDAFGGIDMDNLSMEDVATISQFDPNLGKYAMEQFQFGRQVEDLGRAQGFLNDGIDDENDLWAQEIYGRYGKTSGGATGAVSAAASSLGISPQEFLELPAEVQETALYNKGDEGYKKSADVLGGRDLETLENKAQATKQGDSIGAIDGASIEYMHNASSVDFDQGKAMENTDAIISMLENDELNTGKWQQWFKDATGITTRADGTLGAAATENLIKQINSATFGALSEKEIEQLMQTFAQGGQSKEFNLGTMDMVKKKLQTAQEKHIRDTQRSVDRIKDNNPEEYERFMRDDDNYLRYGGGKDVKAVTLSGGGEMSYEQFYRDGIAQGKSRDEIDVAFNSLGKREEEAIKERERVAAEQAKMAEQARKEMQARGEHLSPYIRRQ